MNINHKVKTIYSNGLLTLIVPHELVLGETIIVQTEKGRHQYAAGDWFEPKSTDWIKTIQIIIDSDILILEIVVDNQFSFIEDCGC